MSSRRLSVIHVCSSEIKQERNDKSLFKEIGCLSDTGKVRRLDEDSVAVIRLFSTFEEGPIEKIFLAVADGMGGHSKGEVASRLGIATIAEHVMPRLSANKRDDALNEILRSSIKEANKQILAYVMDHPECEGMGTTMTVAIIDREKLCIGHVGDSRAYLLCEQEILQLTKDHSFVQELVDKGEITPEEARHHPKRNIITRVVGYHPDVEPDTYEYRWKANDRILICCDGLVTHVEDGEIAETVLNAITSMEACKNLVKLANDRGGKDNISVVLTPRLSDLFSQNKTEKSGAS